METSSGSRVVKPPSGVSRGRPAKQPLPPETTRTCSSTNDNHGSSCNERSEGKRKGRPRMEGQELRSIPAHMMVQWKEEFKTRSRVKCPCSGCWLEFPSIYGVKYHYQRCQGATIAEKLSHGCPYCEAVFATKTRLQKHKLWNHPERVPAETKSEPKPQKGPGAKGNTKRPTENSPPSPLFFKVKKTQEVSQPSQNGECAPSKPDRKQQSAPQTAPSSDASPRTPGGSESEGGSLPPPFPEEDPERMKHRRKQKTPKKFTGEQPSISGTFGLKGINKAEEKLKAGRVKRAEGSLIPEETQKKPAAASRREPRQGVAVPAAEAQWHHAISERGEVVCPTCSVVTRKTVTGLKKHMEICQKLQDALKCQQCQKQFRSKAGLNYHTMAEHTAPKSTGSESVATDGQEERERLRRVLKQMGKIKCPSEGCSAHFSSLMGYQYHQKRCGRELSEAEKPVFLCQHCGKTYRSKAGRDYHLRTEHPVATATARSGSPGDPARGAEQEKPPAHEAEEEEEAPRTSPGKAAEGREERREAAREAQEMLDLERTPSGRVRRRSAQVAVFHLMEIAEDELAKDWGTKRRIKDDLVPDIKRLNYTRPGLPKFNPKTLETWKNEVKEKGFICCPNGSCEAVYSSVSGLKAHLANCNKGEGAVGKYTCLLCQKEFSSESGVKYHISKTHSQNWFRSTGHLVPSCKSQSPQSNGLQKDLKNGVTGKKRGRKPKERPPEACSVPTHTLNASPAPAQAKTPAQSPAAQSSTPTATPVPTPTDTIDTTTTTTTTSSPPSASGDKESLAQGRENRDTNTPVKKRAKPKKMPPAE